MWQLLGSLLGGGAGGAGAGTDPGLNYMSSQPSGTPPPSAFTPANGYGAPQGAPSFGQFLTGLMQNRQTGVQQPGGGGQMGAGAGGQMNASGGYMGGHF